MLKFIEYIAYFSKIASGVFLIAMTLMVGLVVFGRYLSLSVPWADELGRIFFIWSALLGASSATYNKLHFSVSFLTNYFSKATRLVLALVSNLLIISIALFILWAAFSVIGIAKIQILPGLQISKIWFHMSMIITCILMLLFSAKNTVVQIYKLKE
jgi:TRAP-type C4-dicarboxylate transport system permease small subunit